MMWGLISPLHLLRSWLIRLLRCSGAANWPAETDCTSTPSRQSVSQPSSQRQCWRSSFFCFVRIAASKHLVFSTHCIFPSFAAAFNLLLEG